MSDERRDRAYLTTDEVDQPAQLTDTEIYQGELEAGEGRDLLGHSVGELRDGETGDPNVAAEEGLTWVPPIDPPVIPDPDNPEGIQIAAGFGLDANADPFDIDHTSGLLTVEDELEARIREALRADSTTSRYAEDIVIGTRMNTVVVRGLVDDIDDTDNVAEVISNVAGVGEVVDELEVAGVTD